MPPLIDLPLTSDWYEAIEQLIERIEARLSNKRTSKKAPRYAKGPSKDSLQHVRLWAIEPYLTDDFELGNMWGRSKDKEIIEVIFLLLFSKAKLVRYCHGNCSLVFPDGSRYIRGEKKLLRYNPQSLGLSYLSVLSQVFTKRDIQDEFDHVKVYLSSLNKTSQRYSVPSEGIWGNNHRNVALSAGSD
ncbi:uncharacterized protein CANTADRAFT_314488 [Suhomyces tanzawaensis NRRL Y-17324]|uniref:Uncharacterized protein n=1 Tax=Suhomyces tanzawaensis NRRL Y-17324 TaxID=984487 RepID=A0A1E4SDH8_9ASCO|nr:uncharacterized protein CANTADRAFT_314488 [Suhomyces tanzawaensis NRRL Y-17324]ODV77570.1 hypothetical protein CANTADRAFT_314488 [Suhomyces tanzawaensis NRRL Y-17324]